MFKILSHKQIFMKLLTVIGWNSLLEKEFCENINAFFPTFPKCVSVCHVNWYWKLVKFLYFRCTIFFSTYWFFNTFCKVKLVSVSRIWVNYFSEEFLHKIECKYFSLFDHWQHTKWEYYSHTKIPNFGLIFQQKNVTRLALASQSE